MTNNVELENIVSLALDAYIKVHDVIDSTRPSSTDFELTFRRVLMQTYCSSMKREPVNKNSFTYTINHGQVMGTWIHAPTGSGNINVNPSLLHG